MAQYRELAAFAQFASDLDEATRKQLDRGGRVTELLKQSQYSPLSIGRMGASLFAVNKGFMDDVDVNKVLAFEHGLHAYLKDKHAALLAKLEATKALDKEAEAELNCPPPQPTRSRLLDSDSVDSSTNLSRGRIYGIRQGIRTKIKSVENTKKITKAMEMVAVSKCARRKSACAPPVLIAKRFAMSPPTWERQTPNTCIHS